MTRAQERVDARQELAELAEHRAEDELPEHRSTYLERMVLATTPNAVVDEDGALSLTTETPPCDPTKPDAQSPVPHDYEETGEDYGSLGEGGSYTELTCRRCRRVAYTPMAD